MVFYGGKASEMICSLRSPVTLWEFFDLSWEARRDTLR
jgi:hypothetical protein